MDDAKAHVFGTLLTSVLPAAVLSPSATYNDRYYATVPLRQSPWGVLIRVDARIEPSATWFKSQGIKKHVFVDRIKELMKVNMANAAISEAMFAPDVHKVNGKTTRNVFLCHKWVADIESELTHEAEEEKKTDKVAIESTAVGKLKKKQ